MNFNCSMINQRKLVIEKDSNTSIFIEPGNFNERGKKKKKEWKRVKISMKDDGGWWIDFYTEWFGATVRAYIPWKRKEKGNFQRYQGGAGLYTGVCMHERVLRMLYVLRKWNESLVAT